MFDSYGYLHFDPVRRGIKSDRRAILNISRDLGRYYRWWFWRRYGYKLEAPPWGEHITVVKHYPDWMFTRTLDTKSVWGHDEGNKVAFQYDPTIYHVHVPDKHKTHYFVLGVVSTELDQIRTNLGLDTKYPYHITIGKLDPYYWDDAYFSDMPEFINNRR